MAIWLTVVAGLNRITFFFISSFGYNGCYFYSGLLKNLINMGAIKNYLINHPEIVEQQRFDEGYRYKQIELEEYWHRYEDEVTLLNTQLLQDAEKDANNEQE